MEALCQNLNFLIVLLFFTTHGVSAFYIRFKTSGSFIVPKGVSCVNVLVIGGGAGGVLLNGLGPKSSNGASIYSGKGGFGYRAGGGVGGIFGFNNTRYAGGNGADGLVYIQYAIKSASEVSSPSAFSLLSLCFLFFSPAKNNFYGCLINISQGFLF